MIKILDKNLINQIAAGEVIERPASVIKELIENSLDAKASEIIVSVKGIGLEEIIVEDNGEGIAPNDLPLIIERHATSKIFNLADLEKLKTMGFRGEAIPSIASISNMEVISRTKDYPLGSKIEIKDSKIIKKSTLAANIGTKVIVSNLFYNTPARFKYLKSEYVEKKALYETVKRLAIANIKTKFKLIIDNEVILTTYGKDSFDDLVTSLYNYQYTKGLIIINELVSNIKIKLVLFDPSFTRANKNEIYLYCNNRYIQNNLLKESIIQGYQSAIMLNRYPIAFVFLELDPYLIDVNIHPQKLTVKIANEYAIKTLLTDLVKKAIDTNYLKYQTKLEAFYNLDNANPNSDLFDHEMLMENEALIYNHEKIINKLPNWDYLATFRDTYLLFSDGKTLYLLDQHAACERINYEFFFREGVKNISTQELLMPINLELSLTDLGLIKNNLKLFKKYGFIFNNELNLVSVPILEFSYNYEVIIEYLLEKIALGEKDNLEELFNYQIKTKACKASIKAKDPLTPLEREKLLSDLNKCVNPYHCPHGRPVIVALDNYEIEKLFKRIV